MQPFDIHILGCGSALPTTRHNATSQVVEMRGKLYMIDCGEGTQLQLRRSRLHFSRLGHIFISHLHGDHCFGLIGLISTFGLLGRTAPLHIYGHPDLEATLRPQLNYFCKGLAFEVVFHPIDPRRHELIYEDRSLTVHTLPLNHRIPCCGFLFREKEGMRHIKADMMEFYKVPLFARNLIKAGEDFTTPDGEVIPNDRLTTPADPARSYAYCSDTAYTPSLIPLLQGVDLLYHESTFAQCDEARATETHHCTAAQAATIAAQAGVKQLLIGHYSSRYDNEQQLLDEAKALFPPTRLSNEGLTISL